MDGKMEFIRSRIKRKPLAARVSDLDLRAILPLQRFFPIHPAVREIARRIKAAQRMDASVILMMGGMSTSPTEWTPASVGECF
jgi:sugar phosphate isomerase/epimerase